MLHRFLLLIQHPPATLQISKIRHILLIFLSRLHLIFHLLPPIFRTCNLLILHILWWQILIIISFFWPTTLLVLIAIFLHRYQKIRINHQQKIGLKNCQRWCFRWRKNSTKSTKNLHKINSFNNRFILMGESTYFNRYPHFFFVLWPKTIVVTTVNFFLSRKNVLSYDWMFYVCFSYSLVYYYVNNYLRGF